VKTAAEGTTVTILGKEFVVACAEDERAALIAAAAHLDRKMREIQASGKVIGTERSAIMAALNLAHELLALRAELQSRAGVPADVNQKLRFLQSKIDAVLQQ